MHEMFLNNKKSFEFLILPMENSHLENVIKLQTKNNLSQWSRFDYIKQIKDETALNFVAILKDKIIGFVISRLIIRELEIYNISIDKNLQGCGFGSALLKDLINRCSRLAVEVIWLEVRETNTKALEFYKKNGFTTAYTRKDYYNNPVENAVVMNLELKSRRTET